MSSYQYRISHCGDKTVLRPSYLHKGISYTGKTTSLYWIEVQISKVNSSLQRAILLGNHCWACYSAILACLCNFFEDRAPVDEIYKWVAVTWLKKRGYQDTSHSNGRRVVYNYRLTMNLRSIKMWPLKLKFYFHLLDRFPFIFSFFIVLLPIILPLSLAVHSMIWGLLLHNPDDLN